MSKLPLQLQLRRIQWNDPYSTLSLWHHILNQPESTIILHEHVFSLLFKEGTLINDDFLTRLLTGPQGHLFRDGLLTRVQTLTASNNRFARLFLSLSSCMRLVPEMTPYLVEWCMANHCIPEQQHPLNEEILNRIERERPTVGLWAATFHRPEMVASFSEQECNDLFAWLAIQENETCYAFNLYNVSFFHQKMYIPLTHILTLAPHNEWILQWLERHLMTQMQQDDFDIDDFLESIQSIDVSTLCFFVEHFRTLLPFGHYVPTIQPESTQTTYVYNNVLGYVVHQASLSYEEYCHALLLSDEFDDHTMMELMRLKCPTIDAKIENYFTHTSFYNADQWITYDIVLMALDSVSNFQTLEQQYQQHCTMLDLHDDDHYGLTQYVLTHAQLHHHIESPLYLD